MNDGPIAPRLAVRQALFALSGNRCAFPGCDAMMFDSGAIIGEICHIHAQRPREARFRDGLSNEELHGIDNLILLCRNHHKLIDDNPQTYDSDWLRTVKREHELRAPDASSQMLVRLVEALAPNLPDNWWERPGAPEFRLGLASSCPDSGPWTFEMDLYQVAGTDTGNLRVCHSFGSGASELIQPDRREDRKWKLPTLTFQPRGVALKVEIHFWWSGAERLVIFNWETEKDFQKGQASISRF